MPPFQTPTSRRQLLQWAAASASTVWLPPAARSQGVLTGNPFGLGVASGSPPPRLGGAVDAAAAA